MGVCIGDGWGARALGEREGGTKLEEGGAGDALVGDG